jgi:preprotein translocase subunit SecB
MQVNLNINDAKVSFITFSTNPIKPPKEPMKLDIEIGKSKNKPDNSAHGFFVRFNISLFQKEEDYLLNVVYTSFFTSNQTIDEEFFNSTFAKANAPSIAFPYLRAYISNITMQSGYKPLMLQSINFVELSKDIKKIEATKDGKSE